MSNLLLAGATNVTPETTEASLLLGGVPLKTLGHRDDQVSDLIESFRRHTYEPLKDKENVTPRWDADIQQVDANGPKTGAGGRKA